MTDPRVGFPPGVGVGVIVALTFAAAVDDPARFRSSKAVGAHFGLTPFEKGFSPKRRRWRSR